MKDVTRHCGRIESSHRKVHRGNGDRMPQREIRYCHDGDEEDSNLAAYDAV